MCRYKPCVLWTLLHSFFNILMIVFCLGMFMFIGGTYPSKRLEITWRWSLIHYFISMFITLISAMLVYKEVLILFSNRMCFLAIAVLAVNATCLCATIWPPITRAEFRDYIRLGYKERRQVPKFIEWLQFTQGCCGIDSYKDYIRFSGTRLIIDKEDISNDPNEIDDKALPNADVLIQVVFDIPRSCCALKTRTNRRCGIGIPYTIDHEIDKRVNSLSKGCYKALFEIIYNQEPVIISSFFLIFRTAPLIDVAFHLLGLTVHWYYYNRILKFMHAPDDITFS